MLQTIPISSTSKQILFGTITLLIYVTTGVYRSYVAFLLHQLDLPDSKIHLSEDQKTTIASSVGSLTPLVSLGAGILMDTFGRRTCILLMFIPFVISWTLVSLANSYTTLVIAMIIESTAIGMSSSIATYVSETSTTKYRGLLLAMVDSTMNIGAILCSTLMFLIKWNIVSIIFAAMSFGCFLLALILPESPVWLYSKGKKKRAIEILCALRSQQPNELEDEIKDMENSFTSKSQRTGFFATINKCLKGWKQFSICSLFFLLVILSGPLILLSYTVLVIGHLQLPYDSATIALIYSIVSFCGSFLAPIFVHNLKRKVVLTISTSGMLISMLAISLYEHFYFENNNKPIHWIVPIFLFIFTFLHNLGIYPIGFIICGELFPLEARGMLQGMFVATINFAWSISLKFYPLVLFNYGIRSMLWCFTGASVLLVLYAIFILPETKGKTLNEVQEQYFSKKNKSSPKV